jgi:PilZ domain
MKNRRTARRYDLSLPVIVRVPNEKETVSRPGKTRDISTGGVYFTIDNDLRAGTEVALQMTVPAEIPGGAGAFIRATGKVVRVDNRSGKGDQQVGMAAVIELFEIVRNET